MGTDCNMPHSGGRNPPSSPVLTAGEVAAVLGLSTERVRQLDDVLEPMRTARGQRIYRREIVERYASERAAAKAKKLSTSTTG